MNNSHLPAGPVAQGGVHGQGILEMTQPGHISGERHGGGGGGGGRGRRGRHYGSHYHQHQHHSHSQSYHSTQGSQYGQHNQHQHSQHGMHLAQQQMYQAYGNQYNASPYAYGQMPAAFVPTSTLPGFVPYQAYGRGGSALPPQYSPIVPPGPMPSMPQAGVPPMHLPPLSLPSQPQQMMPHSQHLQHLPIPPYSRGSQQSPVVVSTPHHAQQALALSPGQIVGHPPHQSPATSTPHHLPLSASLPQPPHPPGQHQASLPPQADIFHYTSSNAAPRPPSGAAPILPLTHSPTQPAPKLPMPRSPLPSQGSQEPPDVPSTSSNTAVDPVANSSTTMTAHMPPSSSTAPSDPGDDSLAVVPFKPPLPWLSRPDIPFPIRSQKNPRRRRQFADATVEFGFPLDASAKTPDHMADTITRAETPSTQDQPSDAAPSTSPTTPISVQPTPQAATPIVSSPAKPEIANPKQVVGASRPAVPAIPVIPAIPILTVPGKAQAKDQTNGKPQFGDATAQSVGSPKENGNNSVAPASGSPSAPEITEGAAPPPLKPQLWTGLFSKVAAAPAAQTATKSEPDGATSDEVAGNGANGDGTFSRSSTNSLGEAIASYHVGTLNKVAFIEPRGLINTGNMCYMNSVLQVLVFCTPFYDFLDQVGKKAVYSFKSETPLIDAMIMFLREFKVIDSADPADLRRRLRNEDLERYGEAFTPEFVYGAINQISRFSSMRRGHQQDAEEFLGFLLECLNEECTQAMTGLAVNNSEHTSTQGTPAQSVASEIPDPSGGGGWLEVGPRQRAVVTRSSGITSASPVNSIFGGQLRSELRVPGLKDSVTLEPYQSLQLDIDSPNVRNIVDALRGLTKSETVHGVFGSPHGKEVSATKQVFIETLPPVLILHLKRFQFDWQGNGTVKIWKNVGYPLELEIPREIFGRLKRNSLLSEPAPKYRLNAVVYHHGKQASGGHYTVDVLREDSREWIRLDDTVIRRIRADDVAAAAGEENTVEHSDPSSHVNPSKREIASNGAGSSNRFAGMGDGEGCDTENGWSQVSALANGNNKKWSSIANGTANATTRAKQQKDSIKDNKVAYLLFYQRVN